MISQLDLAAACWQKRRRDQYGRRVRRVVRGGRQSLEPAVRACDKAGRLRETVPISRALVQKQRRASCPMWHQRFNRALRDRLIFSDPNGRVGIERSAGDSLIDFAPPDPPVRSDRPAACKHFNAPNKGWRRLLVREAVLLGEILFDSAKRLTGLHVNSFCPKPAASHSLVMTLFEDCCSTGPDIENLVVTCLRWPVQSPRMSWHFLAPLRPKELTQTSIFAHDYLPSPRINTTKSLKDFQEYIWQWNSIEAT